MIKTTQDELHLHHDAPVTLEDHAALLVWFDRGYDEVRPHQSLGYLTPSEYHAKYARSHGPTP